MIQSDGQSQDKSISHKSVSQLVSPRTINLAISECAIITWRGGIGENDSKREGAMEVKFNTYRGVGGALLFHSFLQTGKVVEELSEFKYKY